MHHTLDASRTVHRWNNALPPLLTIDPGDRVSIAMTDSSGGQVQPDWTARDFRERFDALRVHALHGPLHVRGAQPGDALRVRLESVTHRGWAWTALIPGLGLLPEDFPDHHLLVWKLDGDVTRTIPGVTVPLSPFPGVLGVQRAEAGEFRTRAPGPFAGNLDVRQLTAGAEVHIPVFVPGGGLCIGDGHAAQGDGEVCINGMEAPLDVTFTVDVIAGAHLPGPFARVPPEAALRRAHATPSLAWIESDEHPREACKRAVRRAVADLSRRLGVSREVAYSLCSVALDLRISQLVNVPTTTVTALFSESLLDAGPA